VCKQQQPLCSKTVLRTISQAVKTPDALAVAGGGSLYIANIGNSDVTAYTPGSYDLWRRISHVSNPTALAFGP
jgi:sugar lactone lactonase YvrE